MCASESANALNYKICNVISNLKQTFSEKKLQDFDSHLPKETFLCSDFLG